MARPPKNKAPAADNVVASSSMPPPPRQIDVEGFVRVRDSVYSRLVSIQNLLQQFSGDYLRQTNLLLGFGDGPLDNAVEFGGLEGMVNLLPATGLVPMPAEEPKKERKKRHHDPNAPKRPLTPYFLYMQTARPIIAADLGSDAAKGAVQEEGQRRWGTMSQAEKAGWDQAYQYNLRLYNARVHSYKHGNAGAKEMSDEDAQQYAEQHNIPMPTGKDVAAAAAVEIGNDQDAIAQQLQGAVVEEPEEEEEEEVAPESPPVAKTPKSTKKGAAGKRKSAAASTPAEPPTPAPSESTTKKRKRQSKAAEEKPEPEPKKSGRTKKAKSG